MPMGIGLGIGVTRGGGVGWWPAGSELAFEFDNGRGFNSIDRTKTTPDSILTYTNPSAKMVYGSDGVLRYAPHNLCFQSEAFSTSPWADTIGGTGVAPTVTANAGNDPNGNPTADRIQFSLAGGTATTDISRRRQSITVIATPHTFSVYLRSYDGSSTYNMHLTDPSGSTRNIVVTGSWQRFEVSATATGTPVTYSIGLRGGQIPANSNTADVLAWGFQLNAGSSALTYVPTTTAAVYSLPIDHNPTTFEPLGVLIEEQRVNLLLRSEAFDNAAWSKTSAGTGVVPVVTANAALAPDGAMSADLVAFDRGAGNTLSDQSQIKQAPAGAAGSYTGSVWIKAATAGDVGKQLAIRHMGGGSYQTITLTADWALVTRTETYVSGNFEITNRGTITASNQVSAHIWGAQLEAGAFPTSYIPTVASQSTRLADQVSILTSAFGYNAAAGTVAYEADSGAGGALAFVYEFSDGTSSERILSNAKAANHLYVVDGASVVDLDAGTFVTGVLAKASQAFEINNFAACINGGAVATSGAGTMPTVNILRFGRQFDTAWNLNGHIKRLTYFPTRRTNSDLQVLST